MAKKSSFNYKKTVRTMNKAVKALEKASNSSQKNKAKKKSSNVVSSVSTIPQGSNQGCLLPILILVSIPIALGLLA